MCRAALPIVLAIGLEACARTPPPAVAANPGPTPAQRLASADALVRAGCLDCLIAAYAEYDQLRTLTSAADAATAGAIRSAALIAVRERELGMVDEGYLQRARAVLTGSTNQASWLPVLLDIIDVLPAGAFTRAPLNDIDLDRMRVLRVNGEAWSAQLREVAPIDELGAYVWLAFACGSGEGKDLSVSQLGAPVATFRETPLIGFRRATCRGIDAEPLEALLTRDSRFVEAKYFLGRHDVALLAVGTDKLEDADRQFADAYAWRSMWPALTQSIANLAMTVEEFDRASAFYDRTLDAEPHAVDALLGKARALTYQGRGLEAIATLDRLMAERWYLGDARYWRALNLFMLERYDEAWRDIEDAAKLLINADVPKLAGRIAYSRHEPDVSRARFEVARERNPQDCETGFYLGVVLAEQRAWPRTAEVLVATASCLEDAEHGYQHEIVKIRASQEPPARQAAKIARREQYIANGRRQMATSWFDIAVAYYNLANKSEARQFAEKVIDDEQFGERARELLSRLGK